MIIEFTNVIPPKGHSSISVAIVVASCAFFFIPTSLIVLGYLSSRPTGTLVSPLPQGVLSEVKFTPTPSAAPVEQITPSVTPPVSDTPLIAAPNETTAADSTIVTASANNITDHTASVSAGLKEITVDNPEIRDDSQIYLSPRTDDKSIYSIKSKEAGKVIISVDTASDTVRYIDYHIVNP